MSKFGQLYFDRFGIRLTPEEAEEQSQALLELMKIVYKPIPETTKIKVGRHEFTAT